MSGGSTSDTTLSSTEKMFLTKNSDADRWMLLMTRRPSATTWGSTEVRTSTSCATWLAACAPDAMAMPQSASFNAKTSFTPSPVILLHVPAFAGRVPLALCPALHGRIPCSGRRLFSNSRSFFSRCVYPLVSLADVPAWAATWLTARGSSPEITVHALTRKAGKGLRCALPDVRTEIIKLHKKLATTFIYVTHDQTEAMTMGDRIVVMKDGMIQQVDTPQNLYDYPCNIFVAGFIGSPQMNFLDGTLKKAGDQFIVDLAGTEVPLPKEKTADGKLDAYVGKTLKVGIRPEDIKDDEEFLEKHPNSHLSAEVEVSELMGAEIYLYLTYQGQNLMARVAPTSKSRRGDKITVAMDTHKIHLFDPETEKTLLN